MENILSEIFYALSHPNRIKILKILRENNNLCGCEMLTLVDMEQSNLSRHLNSLVRSGILKSWRKGVRVFYDVTDEKIFEIIDLAEQIARGLKT